MPPGFCKVLVETGFTRYHKIMIMIMMMMMIIIIKNTGTPIHFFSFYIH